VVFAYGVPVVAARETLKLGSVYEDLSSEYIEQIKNLKYPKSTA